MKVASNQEADTHVLGAVGTATCAFYRPPRPSSSHASFYCDASESLFAYLFINSGLALNKKCQNQIRDLLLEDTPGIPASSVLALGKPFLDGWD